MLTRRSPMTSSSKLSALRVPPSEKAASALVATQLAGKPKKRNAWQAHSDKAMLPDCKNPKALSLLAISKHQV